MPEAGLERKIFRPPVSYSGCLLQRGVGCALTGDRHLPGIGLVGFLSPVSEKGEEEGEDALSDLRVFGLADGSGNQTCVCLLGARQS